MSSKMVVRILSIALALLFLSIFFPALSKADISVESPENPINFGDVAIDSQKTITLGIKNENDPNAVNRIAITLFFRLETGNLEPGDTCGFSFDVKAMPQSVDAGEIGYVDVTYKPPELGTCSESVYLIVLWTGGGYGNLAVPLEGRGVPSAPSTVFIDGQDTGVENRLHEEQTISERLEKCSENAKNHGQYVRCVALMARMLRKAQVLTEEEGQTIMKAAAHANIPPVESGLEGLSYDDRPVTELIKECKENAGSNRQYEQCVSHLVKEMKKDGVIKTRKDKHLIRRYAARLRFDSKHHK